MPTDTASSTVVVEAPLAQVLEHLRAVESTPEWVPDIKEVEVLYEQIVEEDVEVVEEVEVFRERPVIRTVEVPSY